MLIDFKNGVRYNLNMLIRKETDSIPVDVLAENGGKSGRKQLREKGKEYFSAMGKKSAEKRRKDKRFSGDYYKRLGEHGARVKKAKREGREAEPLPQIQPEAKKSVISTINGFIKGNLT